MPRLYRERVDITSVLKNILDNYPAGGTVLRELLQNSDDAGAKSQIFILDTTSYSDAGLEDPALASCQGPALLAINDGKFREKDWEALTSIHDSSKSADETTTGKYGLGFRSCYHVTDNPQVLSTTYLLILDPHREFSKYPGGVRLDSSEDDVTHFHELYQPFERFVPNLNDYPGTAIRLPLRSPEQADRSRIKTGSDAQVTPLMIERWFDHFITTELPIAMLYLKHTTSIELQVIKNDSGVCTIASTKIINADASPIIANRSVNRGRSPEASHYVLEIETCSGPQLTSVTRDRWMVVQFVHDNQKVRDGLAKALGRSVAEVVGQMTKDKLLPHVALALPLPVSNASYTHDFNGRLFSLLPLPIVTDFPLHIHAIFALFSSRQHLRNPQEVVEKASRERLLIAWNHYIFDFILPAAWSYLLQNLPLLDSGLDTYLAWPHFTPSNHGDSAYWTNLSSQLLMESSPHSIWPEAGGQQRFPLKQTLVAGTESDDLVGALQAAGVPIIRPPSHIFDLIARSSFRSQILSPIVAFTALKSRIPALQQLSAPETDHIADYIALASSATLFHHIPLVRNVRGDFVTIHTTSIIASRQEAALFADKNPKLIALHLMPAVARSLMVSEVRHLTHAIVFNYLHEFRTAPSVDDNPFTSMDWFCRFWEFISLWRDGPNLLTKIKEHHMIPTRQGGVRRVSARIHDPASLGNPVELLRAVEQLTVPLLHDDMCKSAKIFLREHGVIAPPEDVGLLLDGVQFEPSNESSFNSALRHALYNYLRSQLPRHKIPLNEHQSSTLRALPVFPIFTPGVRMESSLDATGHVYHFVDRSVTIVPNLNDIKFIDASTAPEFVRALKCSYRTEVDVLEMVLENQDQWAQQPEQVSERLVHRFFDRISDLSPQSYEQLRELPFVDVGSKLRPPSKIIDPDSPIAELFHEDDNVFPAGKFLTGTSGSLLSKLRTSGLLQRELSTPILSERILNIRNADPSRALKILEVLDQYYQFRKVPIPAEFLPQTFFTTAWVPAAGSYHMISTCRDRQPNYQLLYDLVLPVVGYEVKFMVLRRRIGWNVTANWVIIEQMKKATEVDGTKDENKHQRLLNLIIELGTRLQNRSCTIHEIKRLQTFLACRAWIPVSDSELEAPERCTIESVDLGPHSRFKALPPNLRSKKVLAFLEKVGVHPRPSVEALLSELEYLTEDQSSPQSSSEALVKTSVAILTAITNMGPLTKEQKSSICIPIAAQEPTSTILRPIDEVCYNNMSDRDSSQLRSLSLSHPSISLELANKLGLQRRSDLEFEMVEDHFESFDVAEDLTTRIQHVLGSYTAEASSNEWIANADDAGATKVSFLCSERAYLVRNAPSPALIEFFEGPSLIVYNSATFTEADFDGLRRVGLGGKLSNPDSIGRFGLGVLSFYHFGDIIMLVSGSSVVFVDPSMENLPRQSRGGGSGKRTGVKMSIQECRGRYPDLFSAINGVEGFDASANHYEGTIFQVPLRTHVHASRSKISKVPVDVKSVTDLFNGPFWANAEKSLFFTKVTSIRTSRRPSTGAISTLWSVNVVREQAEHVQGGMSHQRLKLLKLWGRQTTSDWLVTSSKAGLPAAYEAFSTGYRLSSTISSALAVQLSPAPQIGTHHHLFATLPLPVKTNLNIHVHSPWVLSDNRRQLDLANPQGPGTSFNKWLLSEIVPRLLLHAITLLAADPSSEAIAPRLWPKITSVGTPHDRLVAEKFYQMLPMSKEPLFRTPAGHMVPPCVAVLGTSNKKASVYMALSELCPDRFVIPPLDLPSLSRSLKMSLDWANVDSPAYVRSVLSDVGHKSFGGNILEGVDLDELVWYLLDGDQSLAGLPLLRLENGELICFTEQEESHPLIFSHNAAIATTFGPQHVAAAEGPGKLRQQTADAIIKKEALNFCALDSKRLRGLLAGCKFMITPCPTWKPDDPTSVRDWVSEFWAGCKPTSGFKIELKAEDVDDLPLLPTVNGEFISLTCCRQKIAFWSEAYQRLGTKHILDILVGLGGWVIDMPSSSLPWGISKDYHISTMVTMDLVLGCLAGLGPVEELIHKISEESWRSLADWIGSQHSSVLQGLPRTHTIVQKLPLWEARQIDPTSTAPVLKSLNEISMLPRHVELSTVAMFIDNSGAWFSEYTSALTNLLPQHRIITPQRFLQLLRLPSSLAPEQRQPFHRLLQTLQTLGAHQFNQPFVPSVNLQLSHPTEIYYAGKPLYAFAFQYQPAQLIAPDFHDMVPWLETLGLSADITSEGFIAAVTAIDRFIRQGQDPRESDGHGLDVAFHLLNQQPWMFSTHTQERDFRRIQSLKFIRQRGTRRYISELEGVAIRLEDVLGLESLVRREDNLVAWTQRASFATEPSATLKAIFPRIGIPSPAEVVEHLVTLANAVQGNPQLGRYLVEDVKATYHWLNEHSNEARVSLSGRKTQPIFWNVDEGNYDMTIWHSASTLWLNVSYDDDINSVYSVKTLLGQFPRLLKVSGVREFPRKVYSGPTTPRDIVFEKMHSNLKRFRTGDSLTDVILSPDGTGVLRAHRLVLAASSSYFEDLFTGDYREGRKSISPEQPLEIRIPGVAFEVVESALHYIYVAQFSPPHAELGPESSANDASDALASLVDLLDLSNRWSLDGLKLEVGKSIMELDLVGPTTVESLIERSEAAEATDLLEHCKAIRDLAAARGWVPEG